MPRVAPNLRKSEQLHLYFADVGAQSPPRLPALTKLVEKPDHRDHMLSLINDRNDSDSERTTRGNAENLNNGETNDGVR